MKQTLSFEEYLQVVKQALRNETQLLDTDDIANIKQDYEEGLSPEDSAKLFTGFEDGEEDDDWFDDSGIEEEEENVDGDWSDWDDDDTSSLVRDEEEGDFDIDEDPNRE